MESICAIVWIVQNTLIADMVIASTGILVLNTAIGCIEWLIANCCIIICTDMLVDQLRQMIHYLIALIY